MNLNLALLGFYFTYVIKISPTTLKFIYTPIHYRIFKSYIKCDS